jgi:hypothetical protein
MAAWNSNTTMSYLELFINESWSPNVFNFQRTIYFEIGSVFQFVFCPGFSVILMKLEMHTFIMI